MNLDSFTKSFNDYWNSKPFWCQPWSIILSGITLIGFTWFVFSSYFFSIIITLIVLTWWILFLIIAPKAST
ncbi:DUF6737 family protein [Prochlorococcus sp. MIT 1223]|uniref:DUF6737 family protein n=1 Tax=Prochlorococcus sp. MIT 1223 TaxID=3096217 RepID=UPI002A74C795|nr:DUF6737 family protein [Prochlorococcus sp. MIT 1223]